MMLNIGRLRGSAFDAILDDAAWRAGVNLWMSSWHQVPAGSLPSDEASLIKAAGLGRDVRAWRRIRDLAMHGWLLCDDGLYYHPTVAETVLDAWLTKLVQRLSSGHGNATRHGVHFDPVPLIEDIRRASEMLERLDPKAEALTKTSIKKARAGILPGDVPTGRKRVPSGENSGGKRSQGKGRDISPQPPSGGPIQILEWVGPEEVLAVVRRHYTREADAYLTRYCSWREVPDRALVVRSGAIFDKLKACESDLRKAGWSLVIEQEKVA